MILKTVLLDCPPVRAFVLFTEHASEWWPTSRRHTGDASSEIRLLESGRFWERAADGREVELGRVREWKAPHRLVLDFYPGTDAEHPTEVVVTFALEGEATRVTVEHRPTPASDDLWTQRATRFEQSWNVVLAALARHCGIRP
jgi:uncharacterized protein YndB with AHSA1/START domain